MKEDFYGRQYENAVRLAKSQLVVMKLEASKERLKEVCEKITQPIYTFEIKL